jgi:hypothetical protein
MKDRDQQLIWEQYATGPDDGTGPATDIGENLQILQQLVELGEDGKGFIVLGTDINDLLTNLPDDMPSEKDKLKQFLDEIHEIDSGDVIEVVRAFFSSVDYKVMATGKINPMHSQYYGKAMVIPVVRMEGEHLNER